MRRLKLIRKVQVLDRLYTSIPELHKGVGFDPLPPLPNLKCSDKGFDY
jgi:hypothetical protein